MIHNRKAHNKYTGYELSDNVGRIGCYKDLATALKMAKLVKGHYYIRAMDDRIIEEGSNEQ